MIWRQTGAILLDAYRELNAKKLFWITLILSGLVVASFAMVGINENGLSVLWWHWDLPMFSTVRIPRDQFYKMIYVGYGIRFWLSIIAMVLALVSTCGIFPDLLASGSIDLMLSKPISRTRLFLTKYATGLLFVLLQVGVFSVASFLVIGVRGGSWEPGLFLAVPVVLLMFSYLFGLMTLLGVITRSAIAALLFTILIWFFIFLVNVADNMLLTFTTKSELDVQRHQEVIADTEQKVGELRAELETLMAPDEAATEDQADTPDANPKVARLESRISVGEAYLKKVHEDLTDAEKLERALAPWFRIIHTAKTVLPKTDETTQLLRRWMVDIANLQEEDIADARQHQEPDEALKSLFPEGDEKRPRSTQVTMEEVQAAVIKKVDARSVSWVIGTSLAFEGVTVLLAGFIFWRRDF